MYEAVKNAETVALQAVSQLHSIGSAPQGVMNALATSSTIQVGTSQNKILFTQNTVCTSRVISTAGQAIMLTFGSATTTNMNPSASVGFVQAASSTVVYDSGLYGCEYVTAYGFSASTTITTAEYR